MKKDIFPSKIDYLDNMLDLIHKQALDLGFNKKELGHIRLASEEILINTINYAYSEKLGDIKIECYPTALKDGLTIKIIDWGKAFNPLEEKDPDINTPVNEREIGGLGIFLTKKIIDRFEYIRKDDQNILILVKQLNT